MSDCYFHYSHLLPRKPGILPLDAEVTKQCRRCGILFTTKSRIRKRCEACQTVADQEHQAKANARLKARRAANNESEPSSPPARPNKAVVMPVTIMATATKRRVMLLAASQ